MDAKNSLKIEIDGKKTEMDGLVFMGKMGMGKMAWALVAVVWRTLMEPRELASAHHAQMSLANTFLRPMAICVLLMSVGIFAT